MDSETLISLIVKEVLNEMDNTIPVEVSARHVHLSREHVEALFGKDYRLTHKRDLSQPGQFLCEERVRIIGAKGVFDNVAILGPVRKNTQVEISQTDCLTVGIAAPLRESGDTDRSAGCCIAFKNKFVMIDEGVIVAKRHIHMTSDDARKFNVRDSQNVSVRIDSERPVIFEDVVIRCKEDFLLSMHIDFDEANSCLLKSGVKARIVPAVCLP